MPKTGLFPLIKLQFTWTKHDSLFIVNLSTPTHLKNHNHEKSTRKTAKDNQYLSDIFINSKKQTFNLDRQCLFLVILFRNE